MKKKKKTALWGASWTNIPQWGWNGGSMWHTTEIY